MTVREATDEDIDAITTLFSNTVQVINAKDYTSDQIDVWSNSTNKETWKSKIQDQYFILCEENRQLLGFSSLDSLGYLDYMYVDADHQNKGVASTMLHSILTQAASQQNKIIWASVSKTAKPFFVSKGFKVVKEESKKIGQVRFTNSIMEKSI